jgi:hypothetical protein
MLSLTYAVPSATRCVSFTAALFVGHQELPHPMGAAGATGHHEPPPISSLWWHHSVSGASLPLSLPLPPMAMAGAVEEGALSTVAEEEALAPGSYSAASVAGSAGGAGNGGGSGNGNGGGGGGGGAGATTRAVGVTPAAAAAGGVAPAVVRTHSGTTATTTTTASSDSSPAAAARRRASGLEGATPPVRSPLHRDAGLSERGSAGGAAGTQVAEAATGHVAAAATAAHQHAASLAMAAGTGRESGIGMSGMLPGTAAGRGVVLGWPQPLFTQRQDRDLGRGPLRAATGRADQGSLAPLPDAAALGRLPPWATELLATHVARTPGSRQEHHSGPSSAWSTNGATARSMLRAL